jgi:hypothetical protein
MTRSARLFVLAAVLCTPLPLAAGQESLGKRVSLDLKAMAPSEAFKVLADAVGTTVTVDPAVTTPVDILVRNVTARTALTTMCESIGCRWTADAGGITVKLVDEVRFRVAAGRKADDRKVAKTRVIAERVHTMIKQPLPDGFVCQNMPLATFGEKVSDALKVKVTITAEDPAMQTVTGDFSHMTLQAALRRLVEQSGNKRVALRVVFAREGDEKSPTIGIMVGKRPATRKDGAAERQR